VLSTPTCCAIEVPSPGMLLNQNTQVHHGNSGGLLIALTVIIQY